jgi:hypothetical protein
MKKIYQELDLEITYFDADVITASPVASDFGDSKGFADNWLDN